jgi:predicted Zn-dependent peptidase
MATRPYGKSFGAALMLKVGYRHDPANLPGIAHLSEHMAFRDENRALSERLTGDGARVNAWTAASYTHFSVAGHEDQLGEAISLFANVMRTDRRPLGEFPAEREILYHEMSEYDVRGTRNEAYYGYWRSVLGDPNWRTTHRKQTNQVRKLTAADVRQFMQLHYRPQNARLAIVAPCSVAQLRISVEQIFSGVVPCDEGNDLKVPFPDTPVRNTTFVFDCVWYMWIRLAMRSKRSDAVMRLAAALVNHQLGGGQHSALYRRLRNERGLAYSVVSEEWPDLDRTLVDTFVSISRRSLWSALDILLEEVRRLAANGVSNDEFDTYRRRIIRRHELAMDHPRELADFLAFEMLRPAADRCPTTQARVDFLAQVSRADVNRAIAELLTPTNRYLFVSGPIGPLTRFMIRRELKE